MDAALNDDPGSGAPNRGKRRRQAAHGRAGKHREGLANIPKCTVFTYRLEAIPFIPASIGGTYSVEGVAIKVPSPSWPIDENRSTYESSVD